MAMTLPLTPRIQNFLSWQANFYSESAKEEKSIRPGPFVTLSREYGCEGIPLAERLAAKLNAFSDEPTPWVVMEKEVIQEIARKRGEAVRFVEALSASRRTYIRQTVEKLLRGNPTEYQAYETLAESLLALAEAGRVVLVGRGGGVVCAEVERGFHVRLVAPLLWRTSKVARERNVTVPEAEAIVVREERLRESFVREFTGIDYTDPARYDMVLNNARNSVEEMTEWIVTALKGKGYI